MKENNVEGKQLETRLNSPLGFFERYLSFWVVLSIVAGVGLGLLVPNIFQSIAEMQYASVNFVLAVFIWVMIYPMMINVDFASIKDVALRPKGLCITLVVNWLVKPFTMAALGIFFFQYVFSGSIDPKTAKEYTAGIILLAVAPCTAMVFVWSQLVGGNANYTLVQVSINDLLMIFLFVPIAAFLLNMSQIVVPWATLLVSVLLYVVVPMLAGYATRRKLVSLDVADAVPRFTARVKPFAAMGLLATVVMLFGFQAKTIVEQPLAIALIAVPLLLQSYGIFAIAYGWGFFWKVPFTTAAPAALIGTSNFFELAVAVAISLFGFQSGAALATVVGVLVEVPVMLTLVAFCNKTKKYFL